MPSAESPEAGFPEGHLVQFYGQDDGPLIRNVGRYLVEGLTRGDGLVVVATPEHRAAFAERLGAEPDHAGAVLEGRLTMLDAQVTLEQLLAEGRLEWGRFDEIVGGAIRAVQSRAVRPGVRAYGEMVGLLWQGGRQSAALELEAFWNRLLRSYRASLLCAYPTDLFSPDFTVREMDPVLCAHEHVVADEADVFSALGRAIDDVLGPRATAIRPLFRPNFRPAWPQLSAATALALWLRNNLPGQANAILDRARGLYLGSQRGGPSPV